MVMNEQTAVGILSNSKLFKVNRLLKPTISKKLAVVNRDKPTE